MRTITKIKYIGIELVFIIATIVALVCYVPSWSKGCYDIDEALANGQTIKNNDYVSVQIDAPIDTYVETTTTKDGKKTDSNTSYLILTQSNRVISLTAKGSDNLSTLDSLCDKFWEYMDGKSDTIAEPVEFKGIVRKINDKAVGYYDNAIKDFGLDDSEKIEVLHIDVNTMQSSGDQKAIVAVLGAISVLFGAFAVFMIIKNK